MTEPTFQDKMKERDLLLQKMAVWQELQEHLLKFLDSDATPTKLGIRSKGESLTVSQSIITVVRSQIEAEIDQLDAKVGNINKAKVNNPLPKAGGSKENKANVARRRKAVD